MTSKRQRREAEHLRREAASTPRSAWRDRLRRLTNWAERDSGGGRTRAYPRKKKH